MYKWKSGEAYSDRYVSFNDFNYVIGFIKKHAFDQTSQTITIKDLEGAENLSLHTKRILSEIVVWNSQNGVMARNEDGTYSNYPQEATWKSLVSRINENPQRYLHAIFDILCNTDILDNYSLNDYEKNLLWSLNKELFGLGPKDNRSLYKIHDRTTGDNVYQIITQVAASTFPEDYLQYYEKHDGAISTRLLQGYELELDAYEIYDRLIEEFGLKKLADLLIENGFCNEATQNEMKDADEGYLAEIVMDTITGDNIYNLLAVDEFRDIVQEYISDAEEQLLIDVADSAAFEASHGPEI